MDVFRTIVPVNNSESPISVDSGVLFMGSCFAENMGRNMVEARFPSLINPFGVLYNPVSISNSFISIVNNTPINESSLVFLNHLWHSFMHHGLFSNSNPSLVVSQINHATNNAHHFLKKAKFLVVTFGSSYVYEHKGFGEVVANCHKFPENAFNRYRLEVDEIVSIWKDLIVQLRVFNPELKFIFTVSPVRHLKDSAHGNQVSKATLLLAVDKLVSLFDKVWYFPAYEIVLDELRDYRFFDAAMVHPSSVAVDYIWKRFLETQFSLNAQAFYKDVQKVVRARNHRPSGHETPEYYSFLTKTLQVIENLSTLYPSSLLQDDKNWIEKILDQKE